MFQAVKLLFIVFRGLLFDGSSEYDIRSPNFKPKRMIAFVLVILSFTLNIIFAIRLHGLVNECVVLREEVKKVEENRTVKKPGLPSSDS